MPLLSINGHASFYSQRVRRAFLFTRAARCSSLICVRLTPPSRCAGIGRAVAYVVVVARA